jgi:hypothetical protein
LNVTVAVAPAFDGVNTTEYADAPEAVAFAYVPTSKVPAALVCVALATPEITALTATVSTVEAKGDPAHAPDNGAALACEEKWKRLAAATSAASEDRPRRPVRFGIIMSCQSV